MVNAYEVGGAGGGEIRYERFYRVYLPSYIISVLTFIALVVLYSDRSRRILILPGMR